MQRPVVLAREIGLPRQRIAPHRFGRAKARNRLPDRLRLGQPARAIFAARHRPFVRVQHRHPVIAQSRDIAPRGGMIPHAHVHRGHGDHRLVGRQQQRGRQIVGDPRRHLRHQVGARGANHHQIRLAAQLDVAHLGLVLKIPQRGIDRLFGQRRQRHRCHELLPALGHDAGHLAAALADQPHQLARFIRRDAAADDQQDPARMHPGHDYPIQPSRIAP